MTTTLRPHPCIPDRSQGWRVMCRVEGCELPCANRRVHIEPEDIPADTRYEARGDADAEA